MQVKLVGDQVPELRVALSVLEAVESQRRVPVLGEEHPAEIDFAGACSVALDLEEIVARRRGVELIEGEIPPRLGVRFARQEHGRERREGGERQRDGSNRKEVQLGLLSLKPTQSAGVWGRSRPHRGLRIGRDCLQPQKRTANGR